MSNTITVRINPITPQSLDSFLRLRSSCINGERDVYFVRSLGTYAGLTQTVTNADTRMCSEMASGRAVYLRPAQLPRAVPAEDAAYYAESFAAWKNGSVLKLKNSSDPVFLGQMDYALRETLRLYHAARPVLTDTMEKNFALKLLYWTDSILQKVLEHWYESLNVKLIAADFRKEQEYLFLYLSVLIGCDVFLLCTEADIEGTAELKALSASVRCGNFAKAVIPAFSPAPAVRHAPPVTPAPVSAGGGNVRLKIPERPDRRPKPTPVSAPAVHAGNVKLKIPEHPNRRHTPDPAVTQRSPYTPPVSRTAPTATRSTSPFQERRERSYEELAALAASVVMIGVVGKDGEINSSGSGIMIGRNGYILTNFHVVREGHVYAVRIENEDKAYVTDQIVKYHPDLDLAVIHIDRLLDTIPVYNGSKPLVRGQKVIAIGSPLGLFNSVSDGIISGFRTIEKVDMIQFTAPISHGSSGGAVLNTYGELIGISTAGIDSGQNINLAVGYESIVPFARSFFR